MQMPHVIEDKMTNNKGHKGVTQNCAYYRGKGELLWLGRGLLKADISWT